MPNTPYNRLALRTQECMKVLRQTRRHLIIAHCLLGTLVVTFIWALCYAESKLLELTFGGISIAVSAYVIGPLTFEYQQLKSEVAFSLRRLHEVGISLTE